MELGHGMSFSKMGPRLKSKCFKAERYKVAGKGNAMNIFFKLHTMAYSMNEMSPTFPFQINKNGISDSHHI